jgi:hypothetical protein
LHALHKIKLKTNFGKIIFVKTQIIQLEEHDDTISVKDKMDWSQTPRVLLVWPERGKIFRNRLDLLLLERHCSSHGSQLAILSKDPDVQFQAKQVGIPVFLDRKTAQLQPWRKSFNEFRRKDLEDQVEAPREFDFQDKKDLVHRKEIPVWGRIIIFTIGVIAVLVIAGLLLPSAEVTIPAEDNWRDLVIPITAKPEVNQVNISGLIPAQDLFILAEDQGSRPSSGQIPLPDEYAQGEVIFTNLTENPIQIPENTILSTGSESPVLFMTLSSGTTPEGSGEQITLQIRALDPGSSGNVESGQINWINHEIGADLSVNNPEPVSGGTDLQIPAPSSDDRRLLSASLLTDMEKSALIQAEGQLAANDILLSTTPYFIEIIEETFSPAEDSPGDTLIINKQVRFGFTFAAGDDLLSLANNAVNALYIGNEYEPTLDSITLEHLSPPKPVSDQGFSWDLKLRWKEKKVLNNGEIIQLLLGKTPGGAETLLQTYLESQYPPDIKITPSWWFRLPAIPFRITITREGG